LFSELWVWVLRGPQEMEEEKAAKEARRRQEPRPCWKFNETFETRVRNIEETMKPSDPFA